MSAEGGQKWRWTRVWVHLIFKVTFIISIIKISVTLVSSESLFQGDRPKHQNPDNKNKNPSPAHCLILNVSQTSSGGLTAAALLLQTITASLRRYNSEKHTVVYTVVFLSSSLFFQHFYTYIHTRHMALFGDPGHFSTVEWTAWQLVEDESAHTEALTTTEEPSGL